MQLVECPNSSHKMARLGKYLIPLDLKLLQRGTTPAPHRRAHLSELCAAYPESIAIHQAHNSRRLADYALPLIQGCRTTFETLPPSHSSSTVATLRDGISCGRHCAVVTSTGEAVAESGLFAAINEAPEPRFSWARISGRAARRRWQIDLTSRRCLPTLQRLDARVAAINARCSHNYYHWLTELLPRFASLHEAGLEADYYLVDCHTDFQRRTLAALGVPESRLIQPHAGLTLQASELLLPCFPTPACLHSFLRVFGSTLDRDSAAQKMQVSRRLYISRRHASTRQLKNEPELEKLLHARGFETHLMEDYTLPQQRRLLASADVVVGVHGAGLANLMFARPRTCVVEIVHRDRYNRFLFPQLSQTMGLRHWQVIAPRARHKQILAPSLHDVALALDLAEREVRATRAA